MTDNLVSIEPEIQTLKRKADDMTPASDGDMQQDQTHELSVSDHNKDKEKQIECTEPDGDTMVMEDSMTQGVVEETRVEEGPPPVVDDNQQRRRNDYDKLRWVIVNNDGEPDSMIKLVGLKSLFSKQLPSKLSYDH
jgi:hypothetical protein